MAHKIRVKPVPHRNKNGTLSETKKDYIVKCQSRGKECYVEVFTTKKQAEDAVEVHRMVSFNKHRRDNPCDHAHRNKHQENSVTLRQVPSRFLPFHRRGEKHHEAVKEWRKNKAQEKESA